MALEAALNHPSVPRAYSGSKFSWGDLSITGAIQTRKSPTYSRAQPLVTQAGGLVERAQVLGGQWRWHNMQAELQTARARGEALLTLAQQTHDPSLLVAAHLALGATAAYVGAFSPHAST